jgi:hypothetical protein
LPNELHDKNDEPIAINIWGDNFIFKGSERTKIKFKQREPL